MREASVAESSSKACCQPRPPGRVAVSDRLAQRLELDAQAKLRQVKEVFQRHRRNSKASLTLGHHQRVADEPRDRLAQCSGADLVVRLQMFDPQLLSRCEEAFDDVVAQLGVGTLDQRARRGFGAAVRRAIDGAHEGEERVLDHGLNLWRALACAAAGSSVAGGSGPAHARHRQGYEAGPAARSRPG